MSARLAMGGAVNVPAMLDVMQSAFDARFGEAWSGPQLLGALSMPDTWAQLAHAHDSAHNSGGVIGFAMTRRVLTQAELLLVAVAPQQRGSGVGRALLDAAMSNAAQLGADEIFLEVRDGNIAALALYQSSGFIEVGRRRSYYSGQTGERFDAITMKRALRS